ncbi:c-type cytochrome [Rhodosalinus halophilus]|uniref:c-type cytochrome n=1 Tax=Rhodosalinus halophilus TaxID=2259333 RepID=UPI0030B8427E
MTFTKVLGGFCGALLVFLLGKWAAESIYHVGGPHGEHAAAYVIETGDEEGGATDEAPAEPEVPFVQLVAQADASEGESLFRQCSACHAIEEERNGVGPHLNGLIGRQIASVEGFRYSGALPDGEWTWENLDPWLEAPSDWAPGTSMAYGGLEDDEDRANLIAYLYSYTDGAELPSAEQAAAAAPAEEPAAEEAATEEAATQEAAAEEAVAEAEEPAAEAPATEEAAAEDAAPAEDTAAAGMSEFAQAVANGDLENGASVWRQCQACHVADQEQNRVGPHLVGIIGREIGSVESFRYSGALPEVGRWTVDELDPWLENPRDYAPGTSMAYAGVKDMQDRADLVAWLRENAGVTQAAATEEAAAPAEDAATEEATEQAAAEDAAASEETAAADAATGDGQATEETAAADAAAEDGQATEETAAAESETQGGEQAGMSEFAQAVAAADPADGQRVWRQCQACHVADQEQNRVGPHLVGIVGREIGSVEGFRYSGALPEGTWTVDELNPWLENPRDYASGTSMAYAGVKDMEDRAALVAWLQENAN